MARDPEDYLVGGDDDNSADMTADASLLGYLQLANDSQVGYLMELKTVHPREEDPRET